MPTSQPNLLARDDTLFGICQGLSEDLGINPNYLRVGLGVLLLWNPPAVVATYVAMGVIVLASRLLFPPRHRSEAPQCQTAMPMPLAGERQHEVTEALACEDLRMAA